MVEDRPIISVNCLSVPVFHFGQNYNALCSAVSLCDSWASCIESCYTDSLWVSRSNTRTTGGTEAASGNASLIVTLLVFCCYAIFVISRYLYVQGWKLFEQPTYPPLSRQKCIGWGNTLDLNFSYEGTERVGLLGHPTGSLSHMSGVLDYS